MINRQSVACLSQVRRGWRFAKMGFALLLAIGPSVVLRAQDSAAEETAKELKLAVADERQYEYFSIDAAKLIAGFDKSHIVSDPPILKANFYQKETEPRIVVPLGVEAYLLETAQRSNAFGGYRIVGIRPRGKALEGSIFLVRRHPDQPSESVLAKFDFGIPSKLENPGNVTEFHQAKGEHFQKLWSAEYAGSAMFRHLAIESMKKAGKQAKPIGPGWPLRRDDGVDSTINMMAGGRAISENLQLDNELEDRDNDDGELVELAEVRGISINAIDWTDRLSKQPTELDPLAELVSEDQYAVFLPSFETLTEMVAQGSQLATPVVHWFEPQARVTDVLGLYQTQLGLPLNAITRQLGGALVGEVAVTGSDPYFRTGTDIAVLMSSRQPELLRQSIVALVKSQSMLQDDVKQLDHQVDGYVFSQWSNPSRRFCSFVGVTGNTVVVTNSRQQMIQVLECADGNAKSMHELDEYKFFRQRYPRNKENLNALVVVTDAAIRRWCGPQWRISASRRTRARATIAEITMQHADELILQHVQTDVVLQREDGLPEAGTMTLTSQGVDSDQYGSLDFQTPIAEMNLTRATQAEVDLYNRWLARYERRWRRVFDPIAIEIGMQEKNLTVDLTVIPLILQSDYRRWQLIVGNSRLKSTAGDHHAESLALLDVAIDIDTPMFNFVRMILRNQMNGVDIDPLGWIDGSASLYFDADENWIKRYEARDRWSFQFEELLVDIPIGFHIPSKDSLRLAAFMVGVRSLLNQFAPNMFRWGTEKYNDFEYVSGQPIAGVLARQQKPPKFYYVTLPDGITLSGNQGVIERAIDRYIGRGKHVAANIDEKQPEDSAPSDPNPATRLKPQLQLRVAGQAAEMMAQTNYRNGLRRIHQIAWSNLPILNYLKHRYPELNPMDVYTQLFGQILVEPTGGTYEWDDSRMTYFSSHHGYHLEPIAGPILESTFGFNDQISTSLSFQDGGLRATLRVVKE